MPLSLRRIYPARNSNKDECHIETYFGEKGIQFTTRCHFKHQINLILIPEIVVESQNVRMAHVRLDLYLSPKLMFNPVLRNLSYESYNKAYLDKLLLMQDFQCENEA